MRRFDAEFRSAKQKIEEGVIGKPSLIKSTGRGPGLPPPWACDPKTSIGMLAEVNSHDFDSAKWLMGSGIKRFMPRRRPSPFQSLKGNTQVFTTMPLLP